MRSALLIALIFRTCLAQAQITIEVTGLPAVTPPGASLHVAGTVNGWDPGSAAWKLGDPGTGTLSITFTPAVGIHQYKFTRGSWASVEGTSGGGFLPNRSFSYNGTPKTLQVSVAGWEDLGGNPGNSTASPNVQLLEDSFYMPQLDRYRKIRVWLPPGYATSSAHYPVVYMQDGQNLFDKATSFAGEWRVDESMDSLVAAGHPAAIIVGIDNGGGQRINEYSPWKNSTYGGGQGLAYIDFLAETLKPFIDSQFRTLPEREHTAVLGSSMGGLISMAAAFHRQDVFGKVGALSSSFWFSDSCYQQVTTAGIQQPLRIALIAGSKEGSTQVKDMFAMRDTLLAAGQSPVDLRAEAHADGTHSEWYWAREFPKVYLFLFGEESTPVAEVQPAADWQVRYDSVQGLVAVAVPDERAWELTVSNLSGQVLEVIRCNGGFTTQRSRWPGGPLVLAVHRDGRIVASGKLP